MGKTETRQASIERVALIGRLGHQGRWPDALAILSKKPGDGIPLDVYACGAVIRACEQNGQWGAALEALHYALEISLKANIIVCNTAISACAKGQQWQWSLQLLQEMALQDVQADVISYSSLVSAYALTRRWEDALKVLKQMSTSKGSLPAPNVMTFSAAISACSEENSWPWALQLLEDMQMQGLETDAVVNTAIMTALSLGGHWQQCLHIATSLEGSLSQTTGNVLATSLQRSAQWTLVLALLQQMEKKQGFLRKCTADAITYSAAIAACGVGGHWRNALDLYGKVSPQNSILLNVAITVCGENLQWQKALQLVSNKLSDTISYNSAITACGNAGRWQHALALFALMPRKAVDLVTFNALISGLAVSRQWLRALTTLAAARLYGLQLTSVTYNATVTAIESWRQSLALLTFATSASVRVDEIGMASAISVCERGHVWQQCLVLLTEMSRWRAMSLIANNALLAAFEKVDDWRTSLGTVMQMASQRLPVDEVSINSCVSACEKSHVWRTAMILGNQPTELIGYRLLLRSCMHASNWQQAMKLAILDEMRRHGPTPEVISLATAVDACVDHSLQTVVLLDQLQQCTTR